MPAPRQTSWDEALRQHHAAADRLADTASRVAPRLWTAPRAPGSWSPAEIVEHLVLAYETVTEELRGGRGMAIRTTWWQRLALHLTIRPRILAGRGFPRGARAPRELRPAVPSEPRAETLRRFRAAADALAQTVAAVHSDAPRRRVSHAYFGKRPLEEALRFCTAHVLHHEAQIAGLPRNGEPTHAN